MATSTVRYFGMLALLALALGCRDNPVSPLVPESEPTLATATQAPLAFQQVSTGFFHSCGVTTAGVAYCWGDNTFGQLGDGTNITRLIPTRVSGTLAFRQLAGDGNVCGVATDDMVYCWGVLYGSRVPVPLPGGIRFKRLALGGGTCGVTLEDRVYCWGNNTYGQLGDGTTVDRSTPRAVSGGRRYRQVASSGLSTCAVTTDDRLFCWGWNESGQLGDGTTVNRLVPTRVRAGDLRFRQVAPSTWHTCAVSTTGPVYCWGSNEYGRLGNGTFSQSTMTPAKVRGGILFRSVTTAGSYTCGVATSDAGYCWGWGPGLRTTEKTRLPLPIEGGLRFHQRTAKASHTCGVTTQNVAYCWGINPDGQLGDGTTTPHNTPAQVVGPM